MAIVISGSGIDMGNNPVSNASQIDGTVINENGDNVATTSNLVGFKNYIINGNFDIWQRGTSGFSGQNYGADRWVSSLGVETYSRQNADSLGGYYARITRTSASTNTLVLTQRIEQVNVKDLKGKILTLSFYTRQTAGTTLPINVYIYTPTIADNYTSATLQQTISALSNPTSTFQKVSISFTVSETMALNGFSITIGNLTAGTSSIDISQVQLEEGSVATPFENRPIGLELSLCHRYYCIVKVTPTVNSVWLYTFLPVAMRVLPTITLKSGGLNGATYIAMTNSSMRQNAASTGAIDAELSCSAEL